MIGWHCRCLMPRSTASARAYSGLAIPCRVESCVQHLCFACCCGVWSSLRSSLFCCFYFLSSLRFLGLACCLLPALFLLLFLVRLVFRWCGCFASFYFSYPLCFCVWAAVFFALFFCLCCRCDCVAAGAACVRCLLSCVRCCLNRPLLVFCAVVIVLCLDTHRAAL